MSDEQDQQFVNFVLKTIVDRPDDVRVDRTVDEMGVLLTVTVHPEDMGKVIGKSGQTAKAIRSLLKVVGAKHDARVNMKIIEPEGGNGGKGAKEGSAAAAADVTDASAAGTDEASDHVPVQDRSEAEAAAEQQQTTADQPGDEEAMDSDVDDATGQPTDAADDDAPEHKEALGEKSPLDEL